DRHRLTLWIGKHCRCERRIRGCIGADDGAGPRRTVERHAVIAGIARVPRDVLRIAVRRHQFGKSGAIEHRPGLIALDDGDIVDLDAAPWMDADMETPAIPENLAAADAEARTIRLRGDKRTKWPGGRRPGTLRRRAGRCAGARSGIEDLLDDATHEIDTGIEAAHFHVIADRIPHER